MVDGLRARGVEPVPTLFHRNLPQGLKDDGGRLNPVERLPVAPLVVGQDPSAWTTRIAFSTFIASRTINLPGIFAGAVVTIAPLVVMFVIAQRYIVEGIATSGLKG